MGVENTFYSKRTHSIVRIFLQFKALDCDGELQENTFFSKRTHSVFREHVL